MLETLFGFCLEKFGLCLFRWENCHAVFFADMCGFNITPQLARGLVRVQMLVSRRALPDSSSVCVLETPFVFCLEKFGPALGFLRVFSDVASFLCAMRVSNAMPKSKNGTFFSKTPPAGPVSLVSSSSMYVTKSLSLSPVKIGPAQSF